ncbi:MAG: hypothetical protein MJK14_17025, partial [Rivularia sp. ALOHA_DT_140]|nr:hypothetical protein [Rivularia sp. ALOHA_DT_140]
MTYYILKILTSSSVMVLAFIKIWGWEPSPATSDISSRFNQSTSKPWKTASLGYTFTGHSDSVWSIAIGPHQV